MGKRKNPGVEAFDKEGPQTMAAGYTWCPECQASFQGEACPGCIDLSGAGAQEPNQPGDAKALKGPGNVPPEAVAGVSTCQKCGATYLADKCPMCDESGAVVDAELSEGDLKALSTETTTITEILPVPLSDPEYKEFGIKLGLANQEISQAEDELASVKSQYKSRIVSAEGRRNEYAAIINAGHQQKQVECHLVKDFQENTITLVRLDTLEIIRTRTMTTAERQRGLFQPPPPDPSCIDPTD